MRTVLISLMGLLTAAVVQAEVHSGASAPWGKADPAAGKPLHEQKCVACHVRLQGGDGSRMYTRDSMLLATRLDLLQRVAACNAQVSAGWFPEEEGHVAAWLNATYYKFQH